MTNLNGGELERLEAREPKSKTRVQTENLVDMSVLNAIDVVVD